MADGGFTRVSPWAPHVQGIVSFPGHAVFAISYDVTDATLVDLGVDGGEGAHDPRVICELAGPRGWIGSLDILLLGVGTGNAGGDALVSRPDLAKLPIVERTRRTCQNLQVLGNSDPAVQDVVVIAHGVAGVRQIAVDVGPERAGRGQAATVIAQALAGVPEGELVVVTVPAGRAPALRALLRAGFTPVGSIQLFSDRPERRVA